MQRKWYANVLLSYFEINFVLQYNSRLLLYHSSLFKVLGNTTLFSSV